MTVAGDGGLFEADDFHALGLDAAEVLDGWRETVLRIVGDGDDAASGVAVFRLQVKQGLFGISTDFQREGRRGGEAAAVFADFERSGDEDVVKAGAQVFG